MDSFAAEFAVAAVRESRLAAAWAGLRIGRHLVRSRTAFEVESHTWLHLSSLYLFHHPAAVESSRDRFEFLVQLVRRDCMPLELGLGPELTVVMSWKRHLLM